LSQVTGGLTAHAVLMVIAAVVLIVMCMHQLTESQDRAAGTSGTQPRQFIAEIGTRGGTLCQSQSSLPSDARRIRMQVGTFGHPGPRLDLSYRLPEGESRALGQLASGWHEGVLDIPLSPGRPDLTFLTVCIRSYGGARVAFAGEAAGEPARVDSAVQAGRVSLMGHTVSPQSVGSLLPELAHRLGRGNAASVGPWTLVLIGLCVMASLALGAIAIATTREAPGLSRADGSESEPPEARVRLCLRGTLRTVPIAAYAVTIAAFCGGIAWTFLTPPFQVPDETSHVAYVQYLAETGKLPEERPGTPPFSDDENAMLGALGFARVIGRPSEKVLTTSAEERYLRSVQDKHPSPTGQGNAATASANPPLYYLLQTPVYLATSGTTLLTQLIAMRILSVLFMATSVLLAFLMARELLPRSPWTWTAAGLACAYQPVLGFVGAGVNPDSLLFLCATGTLLFSARVVQRGLTQRRAIALGLFLLAGLLTKPLFLSLVPAAGLALVWAACRGGRATWRVAALGIAVVVVPMALYVVLASGPLDHPYFAVASSVASNAAGGGTVHTSLGRESSFVLQQYLPRLPFLTDFVPGMPLKDIWINGLAGVFGWVDYQLPLGYRDFAFRLFEVLLALVAVALFQVRRRLLDHIPLAVVCIVALVSVLGAVAITDYQAAISHSARFQQARYLLPLLGLYGGLFALAAKALGPRFGRYALPLVWVVLAFHTFASLVITANRYYL
jgi:hypothetical protein